MKGAKKCFQLRSNDKNSFFFPKPLQFRKKFLNPYRLGSFSEIFPKLWGLGRKTIFVTLPQLETFLGMFCSLVLLIKTINTFVICIWGYISFISKNIDKKNKWLRLRWLTQRLAEAEMEIFHPYPQRGPPQISKIQ